MRMKILFFIWLSGIVFAQDITNPKIFSNVTFNLSSGIDFNTIPTVGTSINFSVISNISSKLNAKLSVGFLILYDNSKYQLKSYYYSDWEQKYFTQLLIVDKTKYTMIPINIGTEYDLFESNLSPFLEFMLGYNISAALTEGKNFQNIAGFYDRIDDIPSEYRKLPPKLNDGSSLTAGIGAGIKYKISKKMNVNIRYIYHYNEAIINYSQLLIGMSI